MVLVSIKFASPLSGKFRQTPCWGINHQKLRSLDHMEKLLYHLVASQTHTWLESNWQVKDALKLGKEEVQKQIKEHCHFLIDSPTSSGGNTDTGGVADPFFSPKNREAIANIIPHQEKSCVF